MADREKVNEDRALAMTEAGAPSSPLLAKLETLARLPEEDRRAVASLCEESHELAARRAIAREGDRPDRVYAILEGWAIRYTLLANGTRQITAFLLPGDFCDLHARALGHMDHSIATLTPVKLVSISREKMESVLQRPAVAAALLWASLVDEAVLRAWIVNVGRRNAVESIGHLLCELYLRMKNVGLTTDHSYALPLTQEDLADALGLTAVHVNRILRRMRSEDLISLDRGALTIHDYRRLADASGFNPNYLHLGGWGRA